MDFDIKKLSINSSKKHSLKKKRVVLFAVISILILFLGAWLWSLTGSPGANFVFSKIGFPEKKEETRLNILLLGNAGGKHDGPYLTDTIVVASIDKVNKKITLISVPRDLWVDSLKAKVNTAYEKGQKDDKGLENAKESLSVVMGLPIHYGVRVDFSGFSKAVDLVEGIDVEVEKTFDDYNYPVTGKENDPCDLKEEEVEFSEEDAAALKISAGKKKVWVREDGSVATESADFACRFEHISFKKGKTHLDGEIALKFVRSRMGTNGEGSDFARSKRQQIVIDAFKSKVLSIGTLANPVKVFSLIDTFGKSFETDIPKEKFLELYNLAKSVELTQSIVLGDLGGGKSAFIIPSPNSYYGAFVVIPPNNDFSSVHYLVKVAIGEIMPSPSPEVTPSASKR